MTGEIFAISFFMLIVAALSFAPFAYFIYMYVVVDNEYGPFHGKSSGNQKPGLEDKVLGLAEQVLSKIKGAAKK